MTIRLGSFQLGHMNIQEALKRTFYHKDLTWIKNNDRVFIHIIMITGTVSYTSTRTLPRLLPPPPLHKKCRRAHTHLSKHASRHTHSVIVHPLTTHSIHWNTWQPPANQLISMTSIKPSFFLNLPPPLPPTLLLPLNSLTLSLSCLVLSCSLLIWQPTIWPLPNSNTTMVYESWIVGYIWLESRKGYIWLSQRRWQGCLDHQFGME